MDNNAEPSYTHLGYRDDTEKVVMYKRRTNFVNVVFTNKDSKKWKNNETAKEELLHSTVHFLKKNSRTVIENNCIIQYLKTLEGFIHKFKNQSDDFDELMFKISVNLTYENYQKNYVIFQFGEKAKKFYIILKGRVTILYPNKVKLQISQEQYYAYLINLKKLNEMDILAQCLIENKNYFPIDDQEIEWFKGNLVTLKGRKNSSPLEDFLFKVGVKQFAEEFQHDDFDLWQKGFLDKKSDKHPTKFLSAEEYIYILTPKKEISIIRETKLVDVFVFDKLLSLTTGDVFGDFALMSSNQKRTATIVSENECHLGVMDKINFVKCLSDVAEKVSKANFMFILSQKIFSKMNLKIFQKQYINFFVFRKLKKGEKLCKQNSSAEYIYFIKDGKFEVSINKSFLDICNIIEFLGGNKDNKAKLFSKFQEHTVSEKYLQLLKEPNHDTIEIISNRDIIGLNDTVQERKYLYDIQLISQRGEVIELKTHYLELIMKDHNELILGVDEFLDVKLSYWIDRLHNILKVREKFIQTYKYNDQQELKENLDKIFELKNEVLIEKDKNKLGNNITSINNSQNKHLDFKSCNLNVKMDMENNLIKDALKKRINKNEKLYSNLFQNYKFDNKSTELYKSKESSVYTHKNNSDIFHNFQKLNLRIKNYFGQIFHDNNTDLYKEDLNKDKEISLSHQKTKDNLFELTGIKESNRKNNKKIQIFDEVSENLISGSYQKHSLDEIKNKKYLKKIILNNLLYSENLNNGENMHVENEQQEKRTKPNYESYIGIKRPSNEKCFLKTFHHTTISKSKFKNKFFPHSRLIQPNDTENSFQRIKTTITSTKALPFTNNIPIDKEMNNLNKDNDIIQKFRTSSNFYFTNKNRSSYRHRTYKNLDLKNLKLDNIESLGNQSERNKLVNSFENNMIYEAKGNNLSSPDIKILNKSFINEANKNLSDEKEEIWTRSASAEIKRLKYAVDNLKEITNNQSKSKISRNLEKSEKLLSKERPNDDKNIDDKELAHIDNQYRPSDSLLSKIKVNLTDYKKIKNAFNKNIEPEEISNSNFLKYEYVSGADNYTKGKNIGIGISLHVEKFDVNKFYNFNKNESSQKKLLNRKNQNNDNKLNKKNPKKKTSIYKDKNYDIMENKLKRNASTCTDIHSNISKKYNINISNKVLDSNGLKKNKKKNRNLSNRKPKKFEISDSTKNASDISSFKNNIAQHRMDNSYEFRPIDYYYEYYDFFPNKNQDQLIYKARICHSSHDIKNSSYEKAMDLFDYRKASDRQFLKSNINTQIEFEKNNYARSHQLENVMNNAIMRNLANLKINNSINENILISKESNYDYLKDDPNYINIKNKINKKYEDFGNTFIKSKLISDEKRRSITKLKLNNIHNCDVKLNTPSNSIMIMESLSNSDRKFSKTKNNFYHSNTGDEANLNTANKIKNTNEKRSNSSKQHTKIRDNLSYEKIHENKNDIKNKENYTAAKTDNIDSKYIISYNSLNWGNDESNYYSGIMTNKTKFNSVTANNIKDKSLNSSQKFKGSFLKKHSQIKYKKEKESENKEKNNYYYNMTNPKLFKQFKIKKDADYPPVQIQSFKEQGKSTKNIELITENKIPANTLKKECFYLASDKLKNEPNENPKYYDYSHEIENDETNIVYSSDRKSLMDNYKCGIFPINTEYNRSNRVLITEKINKKINSNTNYNDSTTIVLNTQDKADFHGYLNPNNFSETNSYWQPDQQKYEENLNIMCNPKPPHVNLWKNSHYTGINQNSYKKRFNKNLLLINNNLSQQKSDNNNTNINYVQHNSLFLSPNNKVNKIENRDSIINNEPINQRIFKSEKNERNKIQNFSLQKLNKDEKIYLVDELDKVVSNSILKSYSKTNIHKRMYEKVLSQIIDSEKKDDMKLNPQKDDNILDILALEKFKQGYSHNFNKTFSEFNKYFLNKNEKKKLKNTKDETSNNYDTILENIQTRSNITSRLLMNNNARRIFQKNK